jgi:pimeloyl-ACP methyl ester carboxylesterase
MRTTKTFLALCLFPLLLVLAGCKTISTAQESKPTIVIVHGAWGGGWDWKHVDHLLTADGYTVYRPTLSGLGERSNFTSTNIDLDTHIQDIVNVILWENLHDVVLVGHSYGGMVITGVADRIPDRIRHVIYVDGLLPENGENANSITARHILKPVVDGYMTDPWVTNNTPPPHDVLMPELTFSEPITLTNQAVAMKLPTTYILLVGKGNTPEQADFYRFYVRAKERGWQVFKMQSDHTVERSHPVKLVGLIEKAIK